jgi:diadenosine tetraphosphatase ApaH/serine/threonine PP2A family protein phosphatase
VRLLILSDIHANIDALEAVLTSAPAETWDRVVVLGDFVGYGAAPNAVLDRIRGLDPLAVIRGNHDKAACGIDDGSNFNQIARYAAQWTGDALSLENRTYLRALPMGPVLVADDVEICHGSPFDEDHYIFDGGDALQAMEVVRRPLCLFGHTHLPVLFAKTRDTLDLVVPEGKDPDTVVLQPGAQYLVNPGSVGQPRDGDPRAAFAIYDSETRRVDLRRTFYPIDAAQRRILAAGLPASLANRLAIGR